MRRIITQTPECSPWEGDLNEDNEEFCFSYMNCYYIYLYGGLSPVHFLNIYSKLELVVFYTDIDIWE